MQAEPPRLGGIRLGRALVAVLYVLLVGSAALSLWGWRSPGALPGVLGQVTPWVFLAFLVCFAFYRLGLVQAGKYPAFKAFFQIGLTLVVWLFLMPGSRRAFVMPGSRRGFVAPQLEASLSDSNPRVRALAAEVARYRPDGQRYGSLLVKDLEDPDADVRAAAHASLVHLAGSDLGGPDDPEALARWRQRFP